MKEKQLFPCDTARLARMVLREDDNGKQAYIIQSRYSKNTKKYESEFAVSTSSPTAVLEAWNAYIGALDTAVNKILRERTELKAYFAELAKATTAAKVPTLPAIKQMLEGLLGKITAFLR